MSSLIRLPRPYFTNGRITLYHGDAAQILTLLPPADLLLTDPPWGIDIARRGRIGNGRQHTPKTWDAVPPPPWLIHMALTRARQSIVWGGTYLGLGGATCSLIWDKMNDGLTFSQAEIAWTNLTSSGTRIFRRRQNQSLPAIDREQLIHPTQKPVPLMEWCIGKAKGVRTMIDSFTGSGAALVAAWRMGLTAVGIERDEEYCHLTANRLRSECI